jgi:IclR family acetate operon transcriptional repressor
MCSAERNGPLAGEAGRAAGVFPPGPRSRGVPGGRPPGPASVVGRAALLLDCLAAGDSPGISELARRSGLAKTTVFRLVHELASCGLVEVTGDGVRLGMRLFELGSSVPRQRSLTEAALPYMRDLHEATGDAVHLAVLDRAEVVYLQILRGRGPRQLPSRVGGRMPAHATGVGKAILAFSAPEVADGLIAAGLARRTARTIVAPGALRRELARIRDRGVSFDREESGPGIVCAASPVFGPDGAVLAALSVTGWSSRLDLDRVAPAVRTAALALSRQLGSAPVQ